MFNLSYNFKIDEFLAILVTKAGGVYAKGDYVFIRSKCFPYCQFSPGYMVGIGTKLNEDDQPYTVELYRPPRKFIKTTS